MPHDTTKPDGIRAMLHERGLSTTVFEEYLDISGDTLSVKLKGDYPSASGGFALAEITVTAAAGGIGYWAGKAGGEYNSCDITEDWRKIDIPSFQPEDREALTALVATAQALLDEVQPLWHGAYTPVVASRMQPNTNALDRDPDRAENEASIRAKAKEVWGDVDLQIDDDAAISTSDAGFWVAAWVFIPGPDEDDNG